MQAGAALGDPRRGTAAAVGPLAASPEPTPCPIQLREVIEETGITFAHTDGGSGRSYQSDFGSRLHFGLGNRGRVDRVEVRWIGGGVDVVENVRADRRIVVAEGGPRGDRCGEL